MSHVSHQTIPSVPGVPHFVWLADSVARFAARVRQRRRAARHQAILCELSDEQFRDIGMDRTAVHPSAPSLEVTAGLMTNLMLMR